MSHSPDQTHLHMLMAEVSVQGADPPIRSNLGNQYAAQGYFDMQPGDPGIENTHLPISGRLAPPPEPQPALKGIYLCQCLIVSRAFDLLRFLHVLRSRLSPISNMHESPSLRHNVWNPKVWLITFYWAWKRFRSRGLRNISCEDASQYRSTIVLLESDDGC